MTDDDEEAKNLAGTLVGLFMIGLTIGIGVSGIVSYKIGQSEERSAAIEAGAGRWVIDEKTGLTKFVYGKE